MNRVCLPIAAALAAAAILPATGHALPPPASGRHDRPHAAPVRPATGVPVRPCHAFGMDAAAPDRAGAASAGAGTPTAEALVWPLLTGGAALLAFARRCPGARRRAGMHGP